MEPGVQPTPRDWLEWSSRGVGLVFVDIVGATVVLASQGTVNYNPIIDAYRSRADALARELAGFKLSDQGDEIFAALPTAFAAYRFARGMFDDAGHPSVLTRVGVHFGRIVPHPPSGGSERRATGQTVHIAAKVMKRASAHELWLTDAVKRTLESESASVASGIGWTTSEACVLDGIATPQLLWRVA